MLPPEYLRDLPEAILALYLSVEQSILADMARRLAAYDYWIPAVEHQRRLLFEVGRTQEDILDALAKISGKSQREIRAILQEAGMNALRSDAAAYAAAGVTTPDIRTSAQLKQILRAGYAATLGTMKNITRSAAIATSLQFERLLDQIWLQVHSGALDLSTAIRYAVKELAEQGVSAVQYPSGHTDSVETAVRCAAVTGVNQTVLQLQWAFADDVGCDLVETTAHAGARPSHAQWQGRVFSRSGRSNKYPDFRSATGYGTGTGLGGWNCRHGIHPYIEGAPRAYTEETLRSYSAKKYIYNGKKLTEYEATQRQRGIERKIKRWKLEQAMLDASGYDSSEAVAKLRSWQSVQNDFIQQTGLKRQWNREQIFFSKAQ